MLGSQPRQDDPPTDGSHNTQVQVERWIAGDQGAFEVLYTRFAPLLASRIRRNAIWSNLRARVQAEDIAQEAWAKVVRSGLDAYTPQGPGSFLAYLARITDNTIIDTVRRLHAAKRGEGREHVELAPEDEGRTPQAWSTTESPTSAARRSEIEELARRVLTQREFAVWELVELQDYTSDEAGFAVDATSSAVRGLLMRARTKLIAALRSESPD